MRLNRLFDNDARILIEADDTGRPLEAGRYGPVKRHEIAEFQPLIDMEEEIERLQAMVFRYSIDEDPPNYKEAVKALRTSQTAFRQLLHSLQLNPVSGLRGQHEFAQRSQQATRAVAQHRELGRGGPPPYIVVAADVDNMKYLNDKTGLGHKGVNKILSDIGSLFKESFNIVENVKLFHPHGDEFRAIAYVEDLDEEGARKRLVEIVRACMDVANGLTSTGYYLPGWEDARRVQPTISFGVSTNEMAADGILTHVKTGASSGKPMKYALTLDRDLRFELGLTREQMGAYVAQLNSSSPSGFEIQSVDGPDVAVYESKMPMDDVRGHPGCAMLECSWDEVSPQRKKEVELFRQTKRAYLNMDIPPGVMRISKDTYIPLKEGFVSSQ